jgi:serine/threonine-protein kinase
MQSSNEYKGILSHTKVVGDILGLRDPKNFARKDAENVVRDLKTLAKRQPVSAFHFAVVHMGLGESDQAFELLNKAWEERYEMMGWLKVDPLFDSLRPDPRFNALVRRMGFPS